MLLIRILLSIKVFEFVCTGHGAYGQSGKYCKSSNWGSDWIIITCSNYDDIENSVDRIMGVATRTNSRLKMKLELEDMAFPNATIARGWYRAQVPIRSLKVSDCEVRAIEPGAFDAIAFSTLTAISFAHLPQFEYRCGLFAGLTHISEMSFHDVDIRQIDRDFLHPVQRTLNIIQITNARMQLDMDLLFGVYKFYNLERIHVDNQPGQFALAHTNFTGLRLIKNLMIVNSGLEAIMANAFDFIGVTLRSLRMSGNQLTTLPLGIFNVMLEKNKYGNTFDSVFMNNPWECDCALLEGLHVASVFKAVGPMSMTTCDSVDPAIGSCPNLHVLHGKKLHLTTAPPAIAYAKFIVKVAGDRVLIGATTPRKYRLWTADHNGHIRFQSKQPKCPAYDWIVQSTRCHIMRTLNESIPMPTAAATRNAFRTICVNYIAFKQMLSFWPLHCVTYRLPGPEMEYFWTSQPIIAMVLCSLAGAAFGTVSPLWYRRIRRSRAAASTAAPKNDMSTRGSRACRLPSEQSTEIVDIEDYDYAYSRPVSDAPAGNKCESCIEGEPTKDDTGYIVFNP